LQTYKVEHTSSRRRYIETAYMAAMATSPAQARTQAHLFTAQKVYRQRAGVCIAQ
jgi:hypothetical protein